MYKNKIDNDTAQPHREIWMSQVGKEIPKLEEPIR